LNPVASLARDLLDAPVRHTQAASDFFQHQVRASQHGVSLPPLPVIHSRAVSRVEGFVRLSKKTGHAVWAFETNKSWKA